MLKRPRKGNRQKNAANVVNISVSSCSVPPRMPWKCSNCKIVIFFKTVLGNIFIDIYRDRSIKYKKTDY